ncbi:MAG: histidine-type phosphatase [Fusobacteria bacterium]|nr:histidine-type phosphatase [Fusobacteriota bacterium]
MKKLILLIATLFTISLCTLAQNTLVGAVLITRHGDRAPFGNIQNFNYNWGSPLQELTPIGMNQAFSLGSTLRNDLVTNEKLLPLNYQAGSITAISSATNRTFDTAECVLMGLYPPGTGPNLPNGKPALPNAFQPIPIEMLQINDSTILTQYTKYLALLNQYVYTSPAWLALQAKYQPYFAKWQLVLGNPIHSLADVLTVGDMITVAKAHGLLMPKGLSTQDINNILDATNTGLAVQFQNMNVSYVMGDQLVNDIVVNLNAFANNTANGTKLYYYSGHDITILPIMALLGAPLATEPGYASNVLIKLYKTDSNQYFVQVSYNGKIVSLPVMNGGTLASLPLLQNYVNGVNLKFAPTTSGSSTVSGSATTK